MTKSILSHKSGIYKITNIFNQKIYVGSAVNLQARFNSHKTNLRANKHHSKKLQNSWNKNGENSFEFSVIEFTEKENLIIREQFYFDLLYPFGANGYNTAKIAGSLLGTTRSEETKEKLRIASGSRKHTEESKIKISNSKKGIKLNFSKESLLEKKRKFSEKMTGRKLSLEHKKKCALAMKGKKHTDETKRKMSESQKNLPLEVRQRMNEGNRLRVTDEMREKCRIASTGRLHNEETKQKLSKLKTGLKLSPETIAKRTETRRKNAELSGKKY